MKHTLLYFIFVIIVLFTFNGCRTLSNVQTSNDKEKSVDTDVLNNLFSKPDNPELTSSLTISSEDFTVNGQLRMRWNKSIQISVNLMGLMEIARIEFLPDHLLVIDRTGKRYYRSTYDDLQYLSDIGVDFYTLQSLFWNKAFVPGITNPLRAIDCVETISQTSDATVLSTKNSDECVTTFTIDSKGSLTNTNMLARVEESIYSLDFDYGSMEKLTQRITFPMTWNIILRTVGAKAAVSVKLSNLDIKSNDWSDESIVGSKYRQITIEELLETIK